MNKIISFFLDWKVKLAILAVIISGAYFWHLGEVKVAVNEATHQIEQEHSREIFKLKERSNQASIDLQKKFDNNLKEKNNALEITNRKYSDLLEWVRNLPANSGSSIPGNPGDSEARAEEVIAELRRRHASYLARYSLDAEEVRINLVACYKDYDTLKEKLEEFKAANSSRIK